MVGKVDMGSRGFGRLDDVLNSASVRELRRLFDESPDAVVTLGDVDGRLLWASRPGSLEGFGRDPSTFVGRDRFDFVHPEDRGQARRMYGRAADGETVRYVSRAHAADGRWVTVATVAWGEDIRGERVVVTITTPVAPLMTTPYDPDGP